MEMNGTKVQGMRNPADGTNVLLPLVASFAETCSKSQRVRDLNPQGWSRRRNEAGVLVMGSFLDQTARATADRKALSAETETVAPSHP